MKTKSKRRFMQRTFERLEERGLSVRDLFLYAAMCDQVEDLYAERRMGWPDADKQTYADAVETGGEMLGERDFGMGLQEDYAAIVEEFGIPGVSKKTHRRMDLFLCFIGGGNTWTMEGV